MELVFPWILYIGIPLVLVLFFVSFKGGAKYRRGNKVANADFVESNPYFIKLMRQYKVFGTVAVVSLMLSSLACVVMLSRPAKIDVVKEIQRNRDIYICMDISSSVDDTNLELVGELKELVKELDGERFGITIFNARAVQLVPLTNDYDYIVKVLDDLESSIEQSMVYTKYVDGEVLTDEELEIINNFDYEAFDYKYSGTLSEEGSSFIGDGLATCLYNFSDLETNPDRARIIIMTTDNEVNGTPLVSINKACELCTKYDVKVFGVTPPHIVDESNFKQSVLGTGGGYYRTDDETAFDKLADDIRQTEATATEKTETFIYDQPRIFFVVMVCLMGIYFAVSRKVKL